MIDEALTGGTMLRATRILLSSLTIATLTGLALTAAPNVYAQSQSPGIGEPKKDVSDQKLDQAAAAIKQVITVKEDYEQRIESAAPDDKERLAEEGKAALEKAVTDQGLSLPEYSSILVIAQNDPEVKEKILQRLK
jgi:hypothetical protein